MGKNQLFMTAKNRIHELRTGKNDVPFIKKRISSVVSVFSLISLCLFFESCDSVSTLHIINNSGKNFECECEPVNDDSKNTENRRTRHPFLRNDKVVFGSLNSVSEDLVFSVIDPITQKNYTYMVQTPPKNGLRPGVLLLQLEHDMRLYYISEKHSIPQSIPVQQPEGYPILPAFPTSQASP